MGLPQFCLSLEGEAVRLGLVRGTKEGEGDLCREFRVNRKPLS